MIEILGITLRTLNYRSYGRFLIKGNAGFVSSTVVFDVLFRSTLGCSEKSHTVDHKSMTEPNTPN